jgi:hypothetical protein
MKAATNQIGAGSGITNVSNSRPLRYPEEGDGKSAARSHGKHTTKFASFRVCSRVLGNAVQ